ncbi:hypothetical protein PPSQR21_032460 [Paenibacillus polymyxa SQR-21]|uniref:hypothetical protein n=1 Tax=Paenibacillus polymyxa TaxID=1406 RepID=UPI00042F61D4|nr:hypothetical protein [Paenibacillus polymyxa]AHM66885.1 hypothetical protein PPSQR21_032460 [Paenibacillus polymyxa SQR-21]
MSKKLVISASAEWVLDDEGEELFSALSDAELTERLAQMSQDVRELLVDNMDHGASASAVVRIVEVPAE